LLLLNQQLLQLTLRISTDFETHEEVDKYIPTPQRDSDKPFAMLLKTYSQLQVVVLLLQVELKEELLRWVTKLKLLVCLILRRKQLSPV